MVSIPFTNALFVDRVNAVVEVFVLGRNGTNPTEAEFVSDDHMALLQKFR